MKELFKGDKNISFVEKGHKYGIIGEDNRKTTSVSKVRNFHMQPFEEDPISYLVARKELRGPNWRKGMVDIAENLIKKRQKQILDAWSLKARLSSQHGDFIHNGLEDYHNTGAGPIQLKYVYEVFRELFYMYPVVVAEVLICLYMRGLCGQMDWMAYRRKSSNVVDISDVKTNLFKGIVYDSIKREDNGGLKHYDRYMKDPVSHLEQCNFNDYALQLSIYAYILMTQYKLRIGNLRIIFIDISAEDLAKKEAVTNFGIRMEYVPFMYHEAEAMINNYFKKNQQVISI